MAGYARLSVSETRGNWCVYLESDVIHMGDGFAMRVNGPLGGRYGRTLCLRQARMLARRLGNIPVVVE